MVWGRRVMSAAAGGGGRPGCRSGPGCRGGLGPVIALALLPALGRLAIDVAVFAGKDVVLTGPGGLGRGRPRLGGLTGPGLAGLDLSRSGLGSGAGSGRLHLGRGPRPRPLGRQIGLVAGAIIEIGPISRTGHRIDDGPAAVAATPDSG